MAWYMYVGEVLLIIVIGAVVIVPLIFLFSWLHTFIIKKKVPEKLKIKNKEVQNVQKEERRFKTFGTTSNRGQIDERLEDSIKRRILELGITERTSRTDKPGIIQPSSPSDAGKIRQKVGIHRPVDL